MANNTSNSKSGQAFGLYFLMKLAGSTQVFALFIFGWLIKQLFTNAQISVADLHGKISS